MSWSQGHRPAGPVRGRLFYAQPAIDRIARQATAGIDGLRMEPPGSISTLQRLLLWRPILWARSRRLRICVQVARGWQIPDLCQRAQKAVAEEVRRLTHYEQVTVNVHVSGTFTPGENAEP